MDWAVLYLRLFTGASMLFHNIGKIQNYNEIISSYPSPLYINPCRFHTGTASPAWPAENSPPGTAPG